MMFVFYYTLRALDSFGPLPDAWILTGSILATYGMARGYVDFWWIWIGVDLVGVPCLSGGVLPECRHVRDLRRLLPGRLRGLGRAERG